jgi:hypothetical protein
VLAAARQVKNLPGRPERDPSDSRWLAACVERGAITACFAATPEFRVIRLHTRYRRELTEERTREKQRTEKLLESAAIKLSPVVSDLHGVTGRDIMGHLIAGVRDPKALAQLARARARRKIAQLERGAGGRGVLHRRARRPGRRRRDRRGHDPLPHRRAPVLLGRPHPAGQPVRQADGTVQVQEGYRYLAAITGETAAAVSKTQTREGARYRRLARRRGKARALVATGNTQLKASQLLADPGMR